MGRRKKLIKNTTIPQHQIAAIARCILPDILDLYKSEEGQQQFIIWKTQRELKFPYQEKTFYDLEQSK